MAQDITDSLKLILYDESSYQCAYCGHREGLDLTIHHVQPQSEGGPTEYGNLIVLCHNCHHRIHDTGSIKPRDVRRIKRHLVHRYFTQAGVNAAKQAYKHPGRAVAVPPYIVQHLVDLDFFEHEEDITTAVWQDETQGSEAIEITILGTYLLTKKGAAIVEQWLLRSNDVDNAREPR